MLLGLGFYLLLLCGFGGEDQPAHEAPGYSHAREGEGVEDGAEEHPAYEAVVVHEPSEALEAGLEENRRAVDLQWGCGVGLCLNLERERGGDVAPAPREGDAFEHWDGQSCGVGVAEAEEVEGERGDGLVE